ncbi:hypothetical protein H4582DRAFT_2064441 [Lactarius indigo]|nr:hypothetical protein H4582DRAFT_2064441 [Lactarius indigo]
MLMGLLRWENARQKGCIWWLLYTQPRHPSYAFLSYDEITYSLKEYLHRSNEHRASRVYRGLSDYVHKESDVHMSRGFPVRQSPIGTFVPRPGQGSLAVGTSGGTMDGHMFEMDFLAPPRHEEKSTNGLENRVAFLGIEKALDLK